MKIGIYTDLHCCRTTSILPLSCENSPYTVREQMIIDTAKWMYDEFEKENVDVIVNGGDTFDSINASAEELSCISDFYSYSKGTREIHIAGNHEMWSTESGFCTDKILSNLPFIELYTEPCVIDDTISVIPYMNAPDVTPELCASLKNKFVVSHLDIKGCHLRDDFVSPDGVELDYLVGNFEFVCNGHMHSAEHVDISHCKNKRGHNVWNIGSVMSSSFSDNNKYIPSICIYDTDTKELKRINNPNAVLFRKYTFKTLSEAIKTLSALDKEYRYCINISCPYFIKDEIKEKIAEYKNIIASRVTLVEINHNAMESVIVNNRTTESMSVAGEFIKYLSTADGLKYPLERYEKIIEEAEKMVV